MEGAAAAVGPAAHGAPRGGQGGAGRAGAGVGQVAGRGDPVEPCTIITLIICVW